MIEEVFIKLISHPVLICFFGPMIFGGGATVVLSILAARHFVSTWIVFLFCSLSVWTTDILWYTIGGIKSLSKLKKWRILHKSYQKASEIISEAKSDVFLLIIIKLASGIGIPTMLYLGRTKRIPFRKFLFYNTIIIILWTTVIITAGWIVGTTYLIAARTFQSIYAGIGAGLTGLIILYIIAREIRKIILKKLEKSR